jgi:hypothetical protein
MSLSLSPNYRLHRRWRFNEGALYIICNISPRFLCHPTAFFPQHAGAMGRQRALHTENSGFAAATLRRHISTFRGYQILFSIQNPYINRFTNHFSIHSFPSCPQVVLHSITAQLCLRPSFRHVDFHFRTYKRY